MKLIPKKLTAWGTLLPYDFVYKEDNDELSPYIKIPYSLETAKNELYKDNRKTNGPLDTKELGMRLTHAESGFKYNAYNSNSGAAGVLQIIPKFAPKGYSTSDLYDPAKATQARNKIMDNMKYYKSLTLGMPSDSVLYARNLAAYNWGPGNVGKFLNNLKALGFDIDDDLKWVDELPKEPREYVNFILRGYNTGSGRNEKSYQKALLDNKATAEIVRKNIM